MALMGFMYNAILSLAMGPASEDEAPSRAWILLWPAGFWSCRRRWRTGIVEEKVFERLGITARIIYPNYT